MTLLVLVDLFSARATIRVLRVALVIGALFVASRSNAVTIVDMNFDGATGLENTAIGPDGVLKGGASIVGGKLVTDGSNADEPTGAGMDLPLGVLSPFGGNGDFSVQFDFSTTDNLGALFSSDGSHVTDPDFEGQEGSLNIGMEDGFVFADFWYIAGFDAPGGPYNDGVTHTLLLEYDATEHIASFSIDAGEVGELDFADTEFPDGFLRDASMDITRLGDENNFDFGGEFNDGCACTFDNLLIQGPSPPPVKLVVDRTTGAMTLDVIATDPTTINSLSITSSSGTLVPTNYLGVDANNPTFDPDDVWQIGTATDTEITESDTPGDADNGATLTSGQQFDLGDGIWKPFFREDIHVSVFDTGLGEDVRGAVEYTNGDPVLFGDLDLDDKIDVADYVMFRDGFSQDVTGLSFYDAYFLGDINGDELHNFEDFIDFATAYDDFNGEGAFAAMLQGVPEPSSLAILATGVMGMLVIRRRRKIAAYTPIWVLATCIVLSFSTAARAAELVEYKFDSDFSDTSGNGRTGVPSLGSSPSVSGGKMQLFGDFEEGLIVPLGSANPFGGLSDYTVEMTFNSSGSSLFPDAGMILFGSADQSDPTLPDNQSMSIYVAPQVDGGSLVLDYFFVGEVSVPDAMLLDGMDHTIKATYVAPDEPGTEEEPNPGTAYLSVDGVWLGLGELTPRQPNPGNSDVRIGGTLNEDFPFECIEGECFTTELEGTVDDFRIFDEQMAPSLLRAEVDLTTGDVTLLGGEFHRDIRYYEIASESGALNPSGWNSFQNGAVDQIDTADGGHWDELVGSSMMLAESFLNGSSFFDENRSEALGSVFTRGSAKDLEITAVTADLEDILVEISYVNAPPITPGDFDEDGDVDGIDFLLWQRGSSPNPLSASDLSDWQNNYGSGASLAAANAAVPEPTSLLSLVVGLLVSAMSRRNRVC